MTAEHETIAVEVGEIIASLDAMCAVAPKRPKKSKSPKTKALEADHIGVQDNGSVPLRGFASQTFGQLFRDSNPVSSADEICGGVLHMPELNGRSRFIIHVVACCGACALAAKSGSWRALAAAHRERGNAAAEFVATNEHLHRMAVMRGKGSHNRGKANDELRAFVLQEAQEKHSGKFAHDAGNEISRRFDPSRKDLSLADFGTPNVTFENTPSRFAEWIRKNRKMKKSPTVA